MSEDHQIRDMAEFPPHLASGQPASTVPLHVARQLRRRMTPQEVKVWVKLRELRPVGLHFRRQVPTGQYVVDFACLKRRLVVEIDGNQHGYPLEAAADERRDRSLAALGFRVQRFGNSDVDCDLNAVIETIFAAASATSSSPTPVPHPARPDGRVGPPLRGGT
jgi:very-short-patch-repair endonuclease